MHCHLKDRRVIEQVRPLTQAPHPTSPRKEAGRGEGAHLQQRARLAFSGLYPETGRPGLRVVVAKPQYLLAMKLAALRRQTAEDRDFEELGVTSVDDLERAYHAFFPEESLPERARLRLAELESAIRT